MRPTAEDTQQAREELLAYRTGKPMRGTMQDHVDTLLAATEPVTDEEIRGLFTPNTNRLEHAYVSGFEDGARYFIGRPGAP